jgi:AraC family transcriptional regulator of adaptative response / DNA-3-methyladenine glycosylase II
VLIETTDLPFAHVTFAAGFASIRQFNDTVREVFALTPSELRHRQRRGGDPTPGVISLRLAYRAPFDATSLFRFLARRAVAGLEAWEDGCYQRTLRLAHGDGTVALSDAGDHVACRLRLEDGRDLASAVERCRRLLDLDADPIAVDSLLDADPLLRSHVRATPGRRVPRTVDGAELAVRAILGQQVSVAGARTLTGRLVARFGKPLTTPDGPLTHLFPEPHALAEADPGDLGVPRSRASAVSGLATALADDTLVLDPGTDRQAAVAQLLALDGVGPWTAQYVAMRAMGDPDVFLPSDLGVRRALEALGQRGDPAGAAEMAQRWRPWRSYALQHLWGTLDPPEPARPRSTTHPRTSKGT